MFDIIVSDEQYQYASQQVEEHSFGNRGIGDGNKKEQLTGIIGQTVVADILNQERPRGDRGFDGGFDFIINGKKFDIKTMTRKVPVKSHYVHNFIGYQMKYDVDGYIFASYNTSNSCLTVCGWVTKKEFDSRAKSYKEGEYRYRDDGTSFPTKAPLYEIKQSDLNVLNNKSDLLGI